MYRVLKVMRAWAIITVGLIGLYGCSDTVLSNKWAREVSDPDVWPLADAKNDMWLKRVDALPLELHLPPLADSSAALKTISRDAILPARVLAWGIDKDGYAPLQQRIVLYVGGDHIPIRDDFCSVTKKFRDVENPSDKVAVRAALCDGPRILTYGRKELPMNRVDATSVNSEIVALSHSLVGALYPPLTDDQERANQNLQD